MTIDEILELLDTRIEYHKNIVKDSWLPWDMEWAEKSIIKELESIKRKIEKKNKSKRKR